MVRCGVCERCGEVVPATLRPIPFGEAAGDDLPDRLAHGQAWFLREVVDRRTAPSRDLTAVGQVDTREDSPERALAAAVVADQPDAFASTQCERDTIEDGDVGVALVEVASVEDRHGAGE